MKVPIIVSLNIVCVLATLAQVSVIGYYPSWKRTVLPPSQLSLSSLSYVIHAFAWPGYDGSVQVDDGIPDAGLVSTVHNAKKKILISLGGGGNAGGFDSVVVHPQLRSTFVKNLLSFVSKNKYDGVDIDWEEPETTAQRDSMISLIRDIRAGFDALAPFDLISMAIPASDYYGRWYNFASLIPLIDWFNALTYDYHGSWSSHAGHNAPLYAPNDAADYSVDQSFQYYLTTRHIPKDKLVLGIPFYGKKFAALDLLSPFTSEEDFAYSDVVSTVKAGGWVYHWDAGAQVPYYTNGSSVITFDDSTSVSIKCQYAKSKQLAGVMIWELSQDLIGQSQPLYAAAEYEITTAVNVAAGKKGNVPADFELLDNYPNPFNPSTTISYIIPSPGQVQLSVYDVLGREVSHLVEGYQTAGYHKTVFRAEKIAGGVYLYKITAGNFHAVKKIILIK